MTETQPPILRVENATAGYGGDPVLIDATLDIQRRDRVALIGPNGSGKSTLLRVMARLLKPVAGRVHLDDQPIARFNRRELARKVAFMPQSPGCPPGVTVRELVGYGRSPHIAWSRRFGPQDRTAIDRSLDLCDLTALQHREVESLSGGERQRAWLAMTVAQEADVLLLDEPVSALDIGHQLEVLGLLEDLNREHGTTIVTVLHDINLAARCFTSLVGLKDHRIIAKGRMTELLHPTTLRLVFGVQTEIITRPGIHHPICVY